MKDGEAALKDPQPEEWEEGYQDEIHALIFLADNDLDLLDDAVTKSRRSSNP